MMFLPSFLKEFHQSWFRYSKEPTFPYSGQYLKLLILNVFLAFKGDTPQSEHFHDLIMRFHQAYVFWRYHVAWSNMSQVMCTVPTLGAGSEWCDTSAGPKGQSTSFSLKSFLYFLMGIDCASTRGIFRKHSDGMNLICSIFIHVCRCCRSNPCDITQSVHRRNLHNSQVMVRSEARNGLRMMPQQHGARKTQHRFLRDFCQFFESNHSDQFKFRNCSECMYVYIYVYVLSVNCKCSFLFIYVHKHTYPIDIKHSV